MEVKAELRHFSLEELGRQRQEILRQEEQSLLEYQALETEYREALEDIVDQALHAMLKDKSWLPYTIEVKEGAAVEVKFRILFSDLSDQIVRRREAERKEIEEARKGAEVLIQELEAPRGDEG